MQYQPTTKKGNTMTTNLITLNVNNHNVKITTDQEITQDYLRELAEFIKKMESLPEVKKA